MLDSLCPAIKSFACWIMWKIVNTLRPRQNGCHFADDIFKCIFLNENAWISLKISLKFVPKVQINNIPALVQIMAWRRPSDKRLSEPMVVSLLYLYVQLYLNSSSSDYSHLNSMSFTRQGTCTIWHIITWRPRKNKLLDRQRDSFEWAQYIRPTIPVTLKTIKHPWACYQIRKLMGCACNANARNVFPPPT